MSEAGPVPSAPPNLRTIRFVKHLAPQDRVLMSFQDPAPAFAVAADAGSLHSPPHLSGDPAATLEILLLTPVPASSAPPATAAEWLALAPGVHGSPALIVRSRGVEAMWRPGRATLQCDPDLSEALLAALIEFSHDEAELRRLEDEVAAAWPELEQDKLLAYAASAADLLRSAEVGERMSRAFQRRIRFARLEKHLYAPDPHLYAPAPQLAAAARKLGEGLREEAHIEARVEALDAHLEVFEHIYEMAAQRLGEFRSSHQEHRLEWIIIALLTLETLFMLIGTIFTYMK